MVTTELIFDAVLVLKRHPAIGGRPRAARGTVISRGRTGDVALYRESPAEQRFEILALCHEPKAGVGGSKQP
ncbi:hypothetical protein GCM10023165_31370 [Variovorax defluvii]|uniref:Uncharacterized protein n=1 Tax=Variovorax defluvii TaxID=913761 RepID=A0ABP8HXB3_9BURK